MSLRHSIRFDIVVVHHRLETEKRIKKTEKKEMKTHKTTSLINRRWKDVL